MRYLFACGGTAGHINPAVGIAGRLKELDSECEVLFIGASGKMETELVPREGYEIRTISISSLSRNISASGLKHNLKAVHDLATSIPAARKIINEFKPDVVIGTGGYVCYPVLREASKMHIPTLVHESNAEPGLTTKMLENLVDVIMVGFEEARSNYKNPGKIVVTGTPVRGEFLTLKKGQAKEKIGYNCAKPLVLSVWGSLGATEMNKTVARLIALGIKDRPFYLVHSSGKRGYESMTKYLETDLSVKDWDVAGFEIKDYIFNMPELMAAADIVVCRSGASTLAELTAMGKPCILVPSPNVVNDHQTKNAKVLAENGGALLIPESEATAERLYSEINRLLSDTDKMNQMENAMKQMSVDNALEEITALVLTKAKSCRSV